MKTKIATALSLVGVLGAGSAAALVNTQILDSGPAGADTSAILTPATPIQSSTTAATTSTTSTTAASTTAATTTTTIAPVVITPAPAPAASAFLTSYNLGASGLVTVDVVNGVTTVISATPNPGWTLVASEADATANKVEVKFTDGTQLVQLEVTFDGTQLVPEVSSALVDASGNTIPNTVANTVANTTRTTVDDDDDDEDETHTTVDDDDDDDHGGSDDHGGDDDDHDDD